MDVRCRVERRLWNVHMCGDPSNEKDCARCSLRKLILVWKATEADSLCLLPGNFRMPELEHVLYW